jgi:hypothetical protein
MAPGSTPAIESRFGIGRQFVIGSWAVVSIAINKFSMANSQSEPALNRGLSGSSALLILILISIYGKGGAAASPHFPAGRHRVTRSPACPLECAILPPIPL